MDKVRDILRLLDGFESEEDYQDAEKQIRQQIGREILETIPNVKGATKVFQEKLIREVCQLEEE